MNTCLIRGLKVFSFCLFACLIILTVDYYVDSYASIRITYDDIGKSIINSNMYRTKDISLSERRIKWSTMNHIHNCSFVALGDSAIGMLGTYNMGEGFYNAFCSGGSRIEDYYAEIYLLYSQNKLPSKMLIEVKPYLFNDNNPDNRHEEWGNNTQMMRDVLSGYKVNTKQQLLGIQWNDLISPSYFQYNFNELLKGNRLWINSTDEFEDDEYTIWHSDGSLSYSLQYQTQYSIDDIKDQTYDMIKNRQIYLCDGFYTISNKKKKEFDEMVSFLKKNDVDISFYLHPYSPMLYEFISNDNQFRVILDVEEYVLSYAKSQGIKVYGSYNPKLCNLQLSDLYDTGHVRREKIMDTFYERNLD